jgi:chloramphenicol 3-O phosphotransferase
MIPTILFINGTSSSGKTSLVKLLQNDLPEPYLDMGIDRFIWMLPSRYLDRPLWDDVLGKADHSGTLGLILFSGMHHAIAAAAGRGLNIIADHVLVEKPWVEECTRLFADKNAYLIGLQCPLEVLEQREKERKDRTLGQARLQFDIIHKHVIYDLVLDTSLLSPEECVVQVNERLKLPPDAFKRIRNSLGT